MPKNNLFFFLLFLFLLSACSRGAPEAAQRKSDFFDLRAFLQKEIQRYAEGKYGMIKEGSVNGKIERDSLPVADSLDWVRLFQLMYDSDINKPALRDSYRKEEQMKGEEKIIRYVAVDDRSGVREFVIREKDGKVSALFFRLDEDNLVYHSRQRIRYVPDSLYRIEARQQVMLASPDSFFVNVRIIPPVR